MIAERLIAEGLSEREARSKAMLYDRCREALGRPEQAAFFVPGRIEVLGKHTDYAGGRSLLCAIERGFIVLAAAREDVQLQFTDVTRGETRTLALDPGINVDPQDWSTYPATVARRIATNFPAARRGADIVFASDLPAASGISSSSAFVIACFLAISAINDLPSDPLYRSEITSPEALAGYLAAMENGLSFGALSVNRGVGTFGGSEDHTAILCCRSGFLSQYSFAPVRPERLISFPASHTFVVAHSGITAEKTGGALASYNRLSVATQRILAAWNEASHRADRTLADAVASAPDASARIRGLLSSSTELRARFDQFVLESTQLIPQAADALDRRDLPALGDIVARSQHAAETMLGNQVPETIALVALARQHGADAASAFGAGFGGSVWALVPEPEVVRFMAGWREAYALAFPAAAEHAEFMATRPGPAAFGLY